MAKVLEVVLIVFVVFCANQTEGTAGNFNISATSRNDLLTDEENKSTSQEIERDIVKDQLLNKDELLTLEAKQKRGLCCSTGPGLSTGGSGRYPPDRYPDRYGGGGGGGYGGGGGGAGPDYPSGYGSGGSSGPSGGGYGSGYSFGHSSGSSGGGGGLYRPYQPSGGGHSYYDGPSVHGGSYGSSYGPGYEDGYHGNEGGGGIFGGNQKSYALKKLLLPLAGLAIVGVAAAISQNPVLLQLGTIKGRKRRSIMSVEDSHREVERDWRVYPGNPKVRPFGKRKIE